MLLMLRLHSGHEYECAAAGMLKIGILKPGGLPSCVEWSEHNANGKANCLLRLAVQFGPDAASVRTLPPGKLAGKACSLHARPPACNKSIHKASRDGHLLQGSID